MNRTNHKHSLRAFSLLLAAAMAITLAGCSGNNTQEEMVSMYDLGKAMLSADEEFPDMSTALSSSDNAEDLFGYLSDMDYQKVDGFFLGYSSEGKADEVAVICTKSAADTKEAVKELNEHVQGRVSLYNTYSPEQVPRAESAEVFSSGRYAVLIISDHPEQVKKAFSDFLTQAPEPKSEDRNPNK